MDWWKRIKRPKFENIAAGMPEDEACRKARLDFGGVDQIKEEYGDS
jgi:hypothetical protein